MMIRKSGNFICFLGGHDLEMLTIRELLEKHAPGRFFDKNLSWGAKASEYREEITACINRGNVPVLIELENDLGLDPAQIKIVDHHGALAGEDRPTPLHRIFYDYLHLPSKEWTRRLELVAANDRGYIPELIKVGATKEELIEIRKTDRAAQGITEEQERAGEKALSSAEVVCDGLLTVVRLPHARTAVVTDRLQLELGGHGYKNLLVLCPHEVDFFGQGDLVLSLDKAFPGGWRGGALPERGFWGHGEPVPDVIGFLHAALLSKSVVKQK
jgi:hypothetical protein